MYRLFVLSCCHLFVVSVVFELRPPVIPASGCTLHVLVEEACSGLLCPVVSCSVCRSLVAWSFLVLSHSFSPFPSRLSSPLPLVSGLKAGGSQIFWPAWAKCHRSVGPHGQLAAHTFNTDLLLSNKLKRGRPGFSDLLLAATYFQRDSLTFYETYFSRGFCSCCVRPTFNETYFLGTYFKGVRCTSRPSIAYLFILVPKGHYSKRERERAGCELQSNIPLGSHPELLCTKGPFKGLFGHKGLAPWSPNHSDVSCPE